MIILLYILNKIEVKYIINNYNIQTFIMSLMHTYNKKDYQCHWGHFCDPALSPLNQYQQPRPKIRNNSYIRYKTPIILEEEEEEEEEEVEVEVEEEKENKVLITYNVDNYIVLIYISTVSILLSSYYYFNQSL